MIIQLCSYNCSYSQTQDSIVSSCDVFNISGYVIFLTNYNSKNDMYDTYYGFCYKNNNENKLINLLETYVKNEAYKGLGELSNISIGDFSIVKNNFDETLINISVDGYATISPICDSLKQHLLYNKLFPEEKTSAQKITELPNATSYYINKNGEAINELKPMISVRKMNLQCFEILYKTFDIYFQNELYPRLHAQTPESFSGYDKAHNINIQEIKNANKKDGYYHVLVPIYRID
ncbi:MAG: hypothetical protein WAU24_02455 [Chitinophagaceae bacterium]